MAETATPAAPDGAPPVEPAPGLVWEVVATVPAGPRTAEAMEALFEHHGLASLYSHRSRDPVIDFHRRTPQVVAATEDDLLVVLVPQARVEAVMDLLAGLLEIDRPEGGMITATPLERASAIVLPPAGQP